MKSIVKEIEAILKDAEKDGCIVIRGEELDSPETMKIHKKLIFGEDSEYERVK